MSRPFLLALALAGLLAGCELLGDTSLPDYGTVEDISYVRHVQVLFDERCAGCHDGQTAELDLTSWEGLLSGSASGGPLVPFDTARSAILSRLGFDHPVEHGAERVPQVEVDFLKRWIASGARHDDGSIPYADSAATVLAALPDADLIAVVHPVYMAVARYIDLDALGFGGGSRPSHVTATPDGTAWFAALAASGQILRFDASHTLTGLAVVPEPGQLATGGDGSWVAIARPETSPTGPVRLLETRDMRVHSYDVAFGLTMVAGMLPGGSAGVVASRSADQLILLPTDDSAVRLAGLSGPRHEVVRLISHDGGLIAVGGDSGHLIFLEGTSPDALNQAGHVDVGQPLLDADLDRAGGLVALDQAHGLWYAPFLPGATAVPLLGPPDEAGRRTGVAAAEGRILVAFNNGVEVVVDGQVVRTIQLPGQAVSLRTLTGTTPTTSVPR
ncbi:MAG: hypothetical protein JJ896_05645 [Rhodothermales bacterium]|nr:hypothetical protein [Rhodothermales bacterium]MBO6779119.1 hypothetical protein [Rhodothermales bacterium]